MSPRHHHEAPPLQPESGPGEEAASAAAGPGSAGKYPVGRLTALYEISKLLTRFGETAGQTVLSVLKIINQELPLRSATFIEKADDTPRLLSWHVMNMGEAELRAAETRAKNSFSVLTRSGVAQPESADAAQDPEHRGRYLTCPLIVRGHPVSGVLHLEGLSPFDEEDARFLSAISNQLAIALGLYNSRMGEISLRKQAEASQRHSELESDKRGLAEKEVRGLNKGLEIRVAERTSDFQDTIKELDAFTYSIAHDLRAPLRHIHSFSELLLGSADEGERAGYVKKILAATEGMDMLLTDLLGYSRLTLEEVECVPVPLAPVLERINASMKEDLAERKARLTIEEPLPGVLANEVLLSQAITNLISNAVKFTAPGVAPRIRVWAELRAGRVRLWVEDNGIGIAPEHQERIFGVFQRLHKTEAYPGTGIGLAIVHRALARMKGRAGVESVPGKGSRFWIELEKAEVN